MGLLDTIKGWFNIGGVKVVIWKYDEPLKKSYPVINGEVIIRSKSNKTILSLEVKLVEEFTSGKGEDRRTETKVLGSYKVPGNAPGVGYPLELKPGVEVKEPFTLNFTLSNRLQNFSGVLGAVGKVSGFLSNETLEFYLVAVADVKGTAFDPTHKVKMKIAE